MKYELVSNEIGKYLLLDNDGVVSVVPQDETNADYQAYLKSLEETK